MVYEETEHELLASIFNETLYKIKAARDKGKLPNVRTSVLPYILNLCEDVLKPEINKSDQDYPQQVFAVSAAFGWTIKQLMPFDTFIDHMKSTQMTMAHKVLEDMLKRETVTTEDVDNAFAKESRKRMAGIA